jgi:hypothetical protein
MFQFYTGFLLILYLTFSISIDPIDYLNAPIKESDQVDPNNQTNQKPELLRGKSHQQVFNEHLRIISIIGSISVGIMILIVSIFIAIQYFRNKTRKIPVPTEQTQPLNASKRKMKMRSTTIK